MAQTLKIGTLRGILRGAVCGIVGALTIWIQRQSLVRRVVKWRSKVHTGISNLRLRAAVTASTKVIG